MEAPQASPIGCPIKVRWHALREHSPQDWIALYKFDERCGKSTEGPLKSQRILIGTGHHGEIIFDHEKIPWNVGVYVFQIGDAKSNVILASSIPFRIACKFSNE